MSKLTIVKTRNTVVQVDLAKADDLLTGFAKDLRKELLRDREQLRGQAGIINPPSHQKAPRTTTTMKMTTTHQKTITKKKKKHLRAMTTT